PGRGGCLAVGTFGLATSRSHRGSRSVSCCTRLTRAVASAAENAAPLGFELGEPQAVDARDRLGDGLAGAQPRQELAQRLDTATIEEVANDPERDVVPGARAQRVGLAGERLHARQREA